jgi:hypothetical protein
MDGWNGMWMITARAGVLSVDGNETAEMMCGRRETAVSAADSADSIKEKEMKGSKRNNGSAIFVLLAPKSISENSEKSFDWMLWKGNAVNPFSPTERSDL